MHHNQIRTRSRNLPFPDSLNVKHGQSNHRTHNKATRGSVEQVTASWGSGGDVVWRGRGVTCPQGRRYTWNWAPGSLGRDRPETTSYRGASSRPPMRTRLTDAGRCCWSVLIIHCFWFSSKSQRVPLTPPHSSPPFIPPFYQFQRILSGIRLVCFYWFHSLSSHRDWFNSIQSSQFNWISAALEGGRNI